MIHGSRKLKRVFGRNISLTGTPAEAMKEFEAKFKSKTGQTWDSCKNGMDTPKPGKYTMVQMARNDLLSGSSSSSMKSSMGKAPLKRKVIIHMNLSTPTETSKLLYEPIQLRLHVMLIFCTSYLKPQ